MTADALGDNDPRTASTSLEAASFDGERSDAQSAARALKWLSKYWRIPVPTVDRIVSWTSSAPKPSFSLLVAHVPSDGAIDEALEIRPDAESLLLEWKHAWSRSPDLPNPLNRVSPRTADQEWLHGRLEAEAKELAAGNPEKAIDARLRHDAFVGAKNLRDRRLHIIDAATTFLSLRHAPAGHTVLTVYPNSNFLLVGHDSDGIPLLERHPTARLILDDKRSQHRNANQYWQFSAYRDASLRDHAISDGMKSSTAILLGMAHAGHRKAFLKAKAEKAGTWTIDLCDADTPARMAGRLQETMYPSKADEPLLIQEHLPFTHEQRFFVLDGRIVASTCSDRHLCALDHGNGRRLDDRIAVIETIADAPGAYERGNTSHVVDRGMAALFARTARRFVRSILGTGLRDFVVDIGMTERGPAVVELNDFPLSGAYGLDHDLLSKAASASVRRFKVEERLGSMASEEQTIAASSMTSETLALFDTVGEDEDFVMDFGEIGHLQPEALGE